MKKRRKVAGEKYQHQKSSVAKRSKKNDKKTANKAGMAVAHINVGRRQHRGSCAHLGKTSRGVKQIIASKISDKHRRSIAKKKS